MKTKNIKKIFINIWKMLSLVMLGMYFATPFLSAFFTVKIALWIWLPSVISTIVLNIYLNYQEWYEKYMTSQIGFLAHGWLFVSLSIFGSAFVINYFDTPYNWWWAIAVIAFILSIILPINIFHYNYNKRDHSEFKHYKACGVPYILHYYKEIVKVIPYVFFYWFVDAFYVSIFTKWFVGQVIFGCLGILIIFYNLANAIITGRVKHSFLLIQDFVLGITGTIYLICIIPDESIQDVVLITVSAVYGGLITLVGVAWTIKETHRQQREAQRLDKIPYLQVSLNRDFKNHNEHFLDFSVSKDLVNDGPCCKIEIEILNVGIGTAHKFSLYWETKNCHGRRELDLKLLKCDSKYCLDTIFTSSSLESNNAKNGKLLFLFEDILGNRYFQELSISFDVTKDRIRIKEYNMDVPQYMGDKYLEK